jgi:hypothetical protein
MRRPAAPCGHAARSMPPHGTAAAAAAAARPAAACPTTAAFQIQIMHCMNLRGAPGSRSGSTSWARAARSSRCRQRRSRRSQSRAARRAASPTGSRWAPGGRGARRPRARRRGVGCKTLPARLPPCGGDAARRVRGGSGAAAAAGAGASGRARAPARHAASPCAPTHRARDRHGRNDQRHRAQQQAERAHERAGRNAADAAPAAARAAAAAVGGAAVAQHALGAAVARARHLHVHVPLGGVLEARHLARFGSRRLIWRRRREPREMF